MTIDVWMQHPTQRFLRQPAFESLRRWTGQQIPEAGGFAMATSRVIKINPNTLKVQDLIRYPYNDTFNFSTVAIQLGKEIWVGSVRGDRVARFPAPTSSGSS